MSKIGIAGGPTDTLFELPRLPAQRPGAEITVITSRKGAGTPVTGMIEVMCRMFGLPEAGGLTRVPVLPWGSFRLFIRMCLPDTVCRSPSA